MQSLHLKPLSFLYPPSIQLPNSHIAEPRNIRFFPQCSLPSENTFSNALLTLRKCTDNEDPKAGSCFHARILKLGLESDAFIGNSLFNMYSKCDQMKDAQNVFDHMPHRTIVSWTHMMSVYYQNGLADETLSLFLQMVELLQPNEYTLSVLLQACALKGDGALVQAVHCYAIKSRLMLDNFLQNTLIDAYAKSGMLEAAEKLLERLYRRDAVSWTSVISGCVSHDNAERALDLFCRMQENGVLPNDVTLLTVLQACSDISNCNVMQWIHGLVLKGNWCQSGLVLNSLMEMHSTNGYFPEALSIFSHFCFNNEHLYPSPETMANLLQGCGNCGSLNVGAEIHGYLIKHRFLPCTIAENSLINMYAKNGDEASALLLFRTMTNRDIISWNTVIGCFVKNDQPGYALKLLGEMHRNGSQDNVSPDFITILKSLEACSDLALLVQGQVIHSYLTKAGLLGDIFVQNALIDMYAKSGRVEFAENIFKEMDERDVGSWNSIILAYGINGKGGSALRVFKDLERSGSMKPNAITFVNVLSACAHGGLIEEGIEIYESMEIDYGIRAGMEHYGCMVDVLGRGGRVEEAEKFIRKVGKKAGADVWGALLNGCVLVGNVDMAEKAAKELAAMEEPNNNSRSIWRVALSNAYAAVGKWHKVGELRAELKQLRKEGGWSCVDIKGSDFSFMAAETKHPQTSLIYHTLHGLHTHMKLPIDTML